jgi:hypothetical protein
MTVLDFPADPNDGDIYEGFIYDATRGVWARIKDASELLRFFIGETSPEAAISGQFWFDSADGSSYILYDDGDSEQWVQFGVGREGPTGPQGPTGALGPTGPTGPTGAQGVPGGFNSTYTINPQTAPGTYTLVLGDQGKLIELESGALAVPANASVPFPIGTNITVLRTGTGQVVISPVSVDVTINGTPGLTLRTQWSSATLIKRATDTWVAIGDLAP